MSTEPTRDRSVQTTSQEPPTLRRSRKRTETEFSLPIGPEEVRTRIERTAELTPKFTLTHIAPFAAILSRRTNLVTWGETIEIRWSTTSEGVDVTVVADLRFPTALGDYGQSRRDIETLFHALSGH
jgi:hypothetical protein